MNPEHDALEVRITALLRGELPPEQAAALEAQIAADPQLAALHARLRHAIDILRESRVPTPPLQITTGARPLACPGSPRGSMPRAARKPRRKRLQSPQERLRVKAAPVRLRKEAPTSLRRTPPALRRSESPARRALPIDLHSPGRPRVRF